MKENQLFIDKATALFFNLHQRYGYGEMYESVHIKNFAHKFDCTNVRDTDGYEYTIGILHQRLLTTVIFCDRPNAFRDSQEAYIVHTLYAGKLGPKGDRENYYPSKFKLIHSPQPKSMDTFLTSYEIIRNLGQISLEEPAPNNINRAPILEIVFDAHRRVCAIKEGL